MPQQVRVLAPGVDQEAAAEAETVEQGYPQCRMHRLAGPASGAGRSSGTRRDPAGPRFIAPRGHDPRARPVPVGDGICGTRWDRRPRCDGAGAVAGSPRSKPCRGRCDDPPTADHRGRHGPQPDARDALRGSGVCRQHRRDGARRARAAPGCALRPGAARSAAAGWARQRADRRAARARSAAAGGDDDRPARSRARDRGDPERRRRLRAQTHQDQ